MTLHPLNATAHTLCAPTPPRSPMTSSFTYHSAHGLHWCPCGSAQLPAHTWSWVSPAAPAVGPGPGVHCLAAPAPSASAQHPCPAAAVWTACAGPSSSPTSAGVNQQPSTRQSSRVRHVDGLLFQPVRCAAPQVTLPAAAQHSTSCTDWPQCPALH